MAKVKTAAIVAILVIAAAAAVVLRKQSGKAAPPILPIASDAVTPAMEPLPPSEASLPAQGQSLPRLVDLGAHACIPCKMMAPILEELKKEHAGNFKTEFIDVWQDAEAGRKYGIRVIPTQIFFDADGKELFRHEGFFSKEDILKKWKEFGKAQK